MCACASASSVRNGGAPPSSDGGEATVGFDDVRDLRQDDDRDGDADDDGDGDGGGDGDGQLGPPWPEDDAAGSSGGFCGCCQPTPSALGALYERWTYSYMNRIFRKGSRQQQKRRRRKREEEEEGGGGGRCWRRRSRLGDVGGGEPEAEEGGDGEGESPELSQSDLYRVPRSVESSRLGREFWATYEATNKRFLRTMWHLAAPTFIPAGYCEFVTVVAQVSIPVIVWQLLLVLEENPYQSVVREGVPYAVLLFVASVVNALFNHRHHHLAFQSGVVIRSAVVDAIYEHSLRLSPAGRLGLTTGQITNLLFEVMQEGHLIWSCPLAMVVVSILLLAIVGVSAIVGIVALLLTVPLVKVVGTRMSNVRGRRVDVTDERVEIVTSMLQGIKVTKLNNYEGRFEGRVSDSRRREMVLVRKEQYTWAWTLVIMVCTPVVATAATFATFVLMSEDNILTAADTFTTLMLFSALRFPINYAGKLIGKAALGYQAACRISRFLARDTQTLSGDDDVGAAESRNGHSHDVHVGQEHGETCLKQANLIVESGTFAVGVSSPTGTSSKENNPESDTASSSSVGGPSFIVTDINLSVSPSEVLAVVGIVGSGKSSLVNGLIGEIDPATNVEKMSVATHGHFGYASQTPFILNATVRDNILFGSPYDKERYDRVLDACCLRQDMLQLGPAGDLTEIGERGVTLSGGQKQRVNIARVVYSKPDIAIFDDPLSALDAGTSRTVFENLFDESPKYDLLSLSAVVLVTHASHFLHRVDRVLVLNEGRQTFYGTWNELVKFECNDLASREIIDAMRSTLREGGQRDSDKIRAGIVVAGMHDVMQQNPNADAEHSHGEIMTIEEREHGLSSLRTWLLWFKYAGGWYFVFVQVFLMSVDRGAYVAMEWWLAFWTDAAENPVYLFGREFPAQTDGMSAQYEYLRVYAVLFVVMFLFCSLRSLWAVSGGARCAECLFSRMTGAVLHAPMSYFETTPLGRILNRFTHDVEIVDTTLTQTMTILIIATSWFVAAVCIMTAILPWILALIAIVMVAYSLVVMHYRQSAADLQRLDAVSRSPVQALLGEGLDGAAVIRTFGMSSFFLHKFQSALDKNSSAMLNFISAHRWLAVRIEILGAIITLGASLLVTIFNDKLMLDPGLVGLLIMWSSNFTITLGFLVDCISESEAAITSIERIHRMSELPQERSMLTSDSICLGQSWPKQGLLQFDGVKLRYRGGLNLALDGLSFKLEHGKRCGVVGRTGAGKSTLTVALFRLVEIESGRIRLDGVDLASLGLNDVRGRPHGMSIIPQDPVLFAGTLRECLDPFGLSSDHDILDALRSVQISNAARGVDALEDVVEEGGGNFSVGERQLLCLARALLVKPKLLVLDEATASVDGKTDVLIQKMLRSRFNDTTFLTIAHRLNTIMDYDVILVMDKGKAVEFGPPVDLLQVQGGVFAELVDATGKESAAALKLMAQNAAGLGRD